MAQSGWVTSASIILIWRRSNMKVMLFAGLKEKTGQSRILLDTPSSLTAGDLKSTMYMEYPSLEGEVFQVACNEAFVKDDYIIDEHDEVALIPPVSGG